MGTVLSLVARPLRGIDIADVFVVSAAHTRFRALSLRQSESIHSDEGLTLETSVFESFTVANLPYRPCGSLLHSRY